MAAPLDPANIDDSIKRYLAGEPWEQIHAATGVSRTTFQRVRSARGIEPRRELVLPVENMAAAYAAIGKYNVDLAVSPVAVEVLGGGWHAVKSHAARHNHILDAGWNLVYVWNYEGASALAEGAADYVLTFLEEIRRQPATVGQYRVIGGGGELLAAGRRDDDEFALVPPPRSR